jgi:hypothetical protein
LGGASVMSSMESGFERAYGVGAPIVLRTAALHRIVMDGRPAFDDPSRELIRRYDVR